MPSCTWEGSYQPRVRGSCCTAHRHGGEESSKPFVLTKSKASANFRRASPRSWFRAAGKNTSLKALSSLIARNVLNNVTSKGRGVVSSFLRREQVRRTQGMHRVQWLFPHGSWVLQFDKMPMGHGPYNCCTMHCTINDPWRLGPLCDPW